MKFTSNKVIELGSAAFRQWKSTHSHCQYIHGYRLTADITFETNELDDKGWVADFGGLKDLKKSLENTFDHKLVVAANDPQIDLLKLLDEAGVAKVVVLQDGVGCERFAAYVLDQADSFINEATEGRVRVKSVQINEHEKNFATAHRVEDSLEVTITQSDSVAKVDQETVDILWEAGVDAPSDYAEPGEKVVVDEAVLEEFEDGLEIEDVHGPLATKEEEFKGSEDQAAPVKPSTKTKGGWFEGTTWG